MHKKRLLTFITWLYKQFKMKYRGKKELNKLWDNVNWSNIYAVTFNEEESGVQNTCLKNNRNFLLLMTQAHRSKMINEPKHKKLEENDTKSPYNQIA